METKLCTLTVVKEDSYNGYEFLLAISSDCLVVLDTKQEFVEWIVAGNDVNGVVAEADNEDEFLDAIIVIKDMIKSGINPLVALFNQR